MTEITLKGGEALDRRLEMIARKVAKPWAVRVGFPEGERYEDGTPVAQIAAIQNFGAPAAGIPARPFFSNMIAEKSGSWGEALANRLKALDWDIRAALDQMGRGIAGQLETSIRNMDSPPNSMVTNLLKQRFPTGDYESDDVWQAFKDVAAGETAAPGKPLVWSGKMLSSVKWEVVEGDD